MIVLLDAGPLGLAANPGGNLLSQQCKQWLTALVMGGVRVMIPEIADYEVRRELLRRGSARSISALDRLDAASSGYVPITTSVMRQAATLWAQARRAGTPTAEEWRKIQPPTTP